MINLPSGLSEHVNDSEMLARFCTSSSWFARQTMRVKYPASAGSVIDEKIGIGGTLRRRAIGFRVREP